jgi:hypothetical protein
MTRTEKIEVGLFGAALALLPALMFASYQITS